MKRICKKTPRKSYVRCDAKTQRLYDEMSGRITPARLNEVLKETKKLPQLNKKPIYVKNRKGVLVEIIGKSGKSVKNGIDLCDGVYYFDGNRIGKRKGDMVRAFFDVHTGRTTDDMSHDTMQKVWQKIEKQSRL